MTDILTDVLQTVRVQAACHGRFELSAPWGVELQKSKGAQFHVVLNGSCHVSLPHSQMEVELSEGDLVALPQGHAHIVRDSPSTEPRAFDAMIADCPCKGQVYRAGGGGEETTMLSGHFIFEDSPKNPLLSALPALIVLRGKAQGSVPWLETTLKFMGCEAASDRPGARTVVNRLADVLFIQMVRGYLAELSPVEPGWLAALNDAQVGAAMRLVHEDPREAWTVAGLASKVGMSRSAFASRFAQLVGEPPLQYVTRWRMHKAAMFLRDGQRTLAEVAETVGYESEAAFSKAFKRSIGSTPGAYRRSFREGPSVEAARAA